MMRKSKIAISKMSALDIPSVAMIERECFSSPWDEKMLSEELTNPCARFYVARVCDEICGYAGLHVILDEGYITNIAVSPKFRRRGVASALVENLICENPELSFITLEVRASNEAAIELYTKNGFESAGVRAKYYSKPIEDAILMTRHKEKENT